MIGYLQGRVILKKEGFVILEVGGVGYEIFLSPSSLNKISEKESSLKLFCYLDVGERSLKLYGFFSFEELELFKLLRKISGVGPKAALEISSIGSLEKIKKEIEKDNEKIFEKIPGIGRKKARKIILELSGKLKKLGDFEAKKSSLKDEVFLALKNLGFQKEEIREVLSKIPKEITESEEKIKIALKFLKQ